MRAYIFTILVFFLPVGNLMTGETSAVNSTIPKKKLEKAVRIANNDGVGRGYCGRGVWSVLTGIGFGRGLQSGNGQDWEQILKKAGWKSVRCVKPSKAPVGSVLVYNSDRRKYGRNKVGTLGGIYGHVELVAMRGGRRVYVSDAPRMNPGGSVPKNFTGRAWLPPGSLDRPDRVVLAPKMMVLGTTSLPSRRLALDEAEKGWHPDFQLGRVSLHPVKEKAPSLSSALTPSSAFTAPVMGMAGVRVIPSMLLF